MKKIVSLIAVGMFLGIFATGCGKFTECNQAKKQDECVEAKFEDKKFTGICHWVANAADTTNGGDCKKILPVDPLADDKALCAAVTTPKDKGACDAVTLSAAAAGKVCTFTNPTTPCELK